MSTRVRTGGSILDVADWAYAGVNHTLAGNGGPECANFLSLPRRLFETIFVVCWATLLMVWSYRRIQVPAVPKVVRQDRGGKRALLVFMCMIFGMEVGFKFSSKTVIYILNPCHVITLLQVSLLWLTFLLCHVTRNYAYNIAFTCNAVLDMTMKERSP